LSPPAIFYYISRTLRQGAAVLRGNVKGINEKVRSKIKDNGRIYKTEIKKIVEDTISRQHNIWRKAKHIPSCRKGHNTAIIRTYNLLIEEAISEIFDLLPLSRIDKKRLKSICGNLFSKYPREVREDNFSGVVIGGFGATDTFPSYIQYRMDCITVGKLKHIMTTSSSVTVNQSAAVSAFAQKEMAHTFMEGIDPELLNMMTSYIVRLLNDYPSILIQHIPGLSNPLRASLNLRLKRISTKIIDEFAKAITKYRQDNYIDPTLGIVGVLSKNDLAEMAESLVHLTSLKRKYSPQSETVGGPIDVAVISKGDGFVWIKRKLYFDKEMNPGFLMRYNK